MSEQAIIAGQPSSLTISEFCLRNRISLSQYHNLKRNEEQPREMAVGKSIRISVEAERDWKLQQEQRIDSLEARRMAAARKAKMTRAANLSAQGPKHVSKQGPRKHKNRGR